MRNYKFIIVASHRRSGTHFAIDSIFNNFTDVEHGYITLHRLLPSHKNHLSVNEFRKYLQKKKIRILKTHSDGDWNIFKQFPQVYGFIKKEILPGSRIIYITRDGRDILNSLFYYLSSMGITFPSFSEFLKSYNNFDGVSPDLNRVEFLKAHIASWDKVGSKLSINFSDLIENYHDVLMRIAAHLELDQKKTITKIKLIKYNIFARVIKRLIPTLFKTTAVLPREGKIGGWKKNFSDEDLDFYYSILNKDRN